MFQLTDKKINEQNESKFHTFYLLSTRGTQNSIDLSIIIFLYYFIQGRSNFNNEITNELI